MLFNFLIYGISQVLNIEIWFNSIKVRGILPGLGNFMLFKTCFVAQNTVYFDMTLRKNVYSAVVVGKFLSTINWIELICLQNFYSHTLLITEKEMILLLRCN